MLYSEVRKESNRFMETDNVAECRRWRLILDDNLIRYKMFAHSTKAGQMQIRFELIGYTKAENERIRSLVGFYYDEE